MPIIWRDDDVLYPDTQLVDLLAVDDLLQAHGCPHTIAIIASTLTPELGAIIRERQMIPQLHCWAHDDLSVDEAARAQLPDAVAKIEDLCGTRPTMLYPPWNRRSLELDAACKALGISVEHSKLSLDQFVRHQGQVGNATINFHYWHASDRVVLAEAMQWV